MKFSSTHGYSLVQIMIGIMLITILGVIAVPHYLEARASTYRVTVGQQAKSFNEALSEWVVRQPSMASAISQFKDGPDGKVPANPQAIIAAINAKFSDESDKATIDEQGHFSTSTMRACDSYFDIVWPTPCRDTYPRVVLFQ